MDVLITPNTQYLTGNWWVMRNSCFNSQHCICDGGIRDDDLSMSGIFVVALLVGRSHTLFVVVRDDARTSF